MVRGEEEEGFGVAGGGIRREREGFEKRSLGSEDGGGGFLVGGEFVDEREDERHV